MEITVGSTDRIVRIVLGIVLVAAGAGMAGGMLPLGMVGGIVAVLVGAVLLVTAVTRTCPAYSVLGMDTLRR